MIKNTLAIIALTFAIFQQTNSSYASSTSVNAVVSQSSQSSKIIINKFLQLILPATSGTITTNESQQILQLQGVDSQVVYFTNHPRRITGKMTTGFFLKRWQKPPPRDFISNPPNALITYIDDSARQQFIIVELIKPQYQENKHSLSFTIKRLPNSPSLPDKLDRPAIIMSEVAICGILGAWGNLPDEKQYDVECHAKEHH